MQSILMIEDDPNIIRINRSLLNKRGYRILAAATLAEARELLQRERPDLLILDIMMPDGSGLDFCAQVRQTSDVPILYLTVKGESEDVVRGLALGGDDYLAKPYDLDVLCARVEALLRRAGASGREEAPLRIGALELNAISRRAYLDGSDLLLGPMEFNILDYLARGRDKYVSAEELYENIWGRDTVGNARTVVVHMSKLRKKLGENAPVSIESQWGKGYRLVEQKKVSKF